jgi:hypothetical protein
MVDFVDSLIGIHTIIIEKGFDQDIKVVKA